MVIGMLRPTPLGMEHTAKVWLKRVVSRIQGVDTPLLGTKLTEVTLLKPNEEPIRVNVAVPAVGPEVGEEEVMIGES